MPITIKKKPIVSVGDVEAGAIDFSRWLDSGELLTGTPTVTEVGTSDLTITNKKVSTTTLVIEGTTVTTGKAVQFLVSGQKHGVTYRIRVTCGSDATPARTKVFDVEFEVQ